MDDERINKLEAIQIALLAFKRISCIRAVDLFVEMRDKTVKKY